MLHSHTGTVTNCKFSHSLQMIFESSHNVTVSYLRDMWKNTAIHEYLRHRYCIEIVWSQQCSGLLVFLRLLLYHLYQIQHKCFHGEIHFAIKSYLHLY